MFDTGNSEGGGHTREIVSSSANLTVELQSQSNCLVANTYNSSVSPLTWRTRLKDRRAQKKWQAKLNGLQAQIDSDRENLLLLEAALQNTPVPEAATQLDTGNLVCLGSWQQEDAIRSPRVGV